MVNAADLVAAHAEQGVIERPESLPRVKGEALSGELNRAPRTAEEIAKAKKLVRYTGPA